MSCPGGEPEGPAERPAPSSFEEIVRGLEMAPVDISADEIERFFAESRAYDAETMREGERLMLLAERRFDVDEAREFLRRDRIGRDRERSELDNSLRYLEDLGGPEGSGDEVPDRLADIYWNAGRALEALEELAKRMGT